MESLADAAPCAKALSVRYDIVPIAEPVEGVEHALAKMFAGRPRDITEENIQSRARGLILMSISNKFGADGGHHRQQVGNVGRLRHALRRHERRLQSDQGPLQDGGLPPRRACAIAGSRSARSGRTARSFRPNIIAKPPSAELRENQKDEDSLPPYPVLDAHPARPRREGDARSPTSSPQGFDPETVRRVERLLYLAEYKRRQSAPGVKVGPKNFGRDRRYPIVNRFRDPGLPSAGARRGDRAARAGGDERAVRGIDGGIDR